MEIRNNFEALKAFLGVSSSESTKSVKAQGPVPSDTQAAFGGDEATLSGIGAAMQSAAGQDGVRPDKVVAVQQALAAGTYRVDASKVANKVIDAMLGPTSVHPERE